MARATLAQNERNHQPRPPTKEPAKERNRNQIEDGRLESGRARLVKQNHGRKQGNSGAEEHGLVSPGDELCQVHTRVALLVLDAEFDPPGTQLGLGA
ncbi:MAG TPA: hypothetical protein VFW31_06405 [Candidatus Angelobacter sp.]|nr:hypothetical protein [Candidatus Angelobacter sp.]